jgi:2,5-diketo-D-gluconate reductase A
MDPSSTLTLRSGNRMPVLGLGTWMLNRDTAGTVAEALRMGYRMIDTSGDYGTQPGVGDGVRRSGLARDRVYLVTKVEEDNDSYAATQRNLGELGFDWADLMLIHRPPPRGTGHDLWAGLIRARDDGLTRDIGVSNYSVGQMAELIDASGEVPAVNQVEWTPFGCSREMYDFCRERKIVIQAYSPLTRAQRLDDERLMRIAAGYGKTPAQLLLRWNLQRHVAPIPKANQRDHLAEDIDVFDFEISRDDLAALDALNEHASSLGQSLEYV